METKAYLFVERDDSEYDYKDDFVSFTEANEYRQYCQRRWMGHRDYVFLCTGYEIVNLTRMKEDVRNELLSKFGIPE